MITIPSKHDLPVYSYILSHAKKSRDQNQDHYLAYVFTILVGFPFFAQPNSQPHTPSPRSTSNFGNYLLLCKITFAGDDCVLFLVNNFAIPRVLANNHSRRSPPHPEKHPEQDSGRFLL
ncbi:hypothetical protein OCU04_011117 [Sclerotinia nivalis]|uniref:Uncharacterized protein n=1 Tax=Sclerotinia nivalis TaxID=352851 RepID=A0A9X0ABN0_9HELO|nr:hypothetical protein OCU04_011117 [Sclerotinia nivalis]